MDDIDKILLAKIEKIDEKVDSVDKTLVRNTVSLEEHVKRSTQLEKRQETLEEAVKPILKAYQIAWGVLKILGAVLAFLATVVAVFK